MVSYKVPMPARYESVELTDAILLTKGQWDRCQHTGIRKPTDVVDSWCFANLRGRWSAGNVIVGLDPTCGQGYHEFGIKFEDPVDLMLFRMRWADGVTS